MTARIKREIINLIKKKAEEIGFDNCHQDPAQMLLIIDLVYDDVRDGEMTSIVSALIHLRSIVLENYRVESIVQNFMQIYKYQKLAQALLNAETSYGKISIEELRRIVKEVYDTRDQFTTYSLMWELYKIGVLTSIKTHNRITTCHVCKSYKEIMRFICE